MSGVVACQPVFHTEGGNSKHCLWLLLLKLQCHDGSTVNMIARINFDFSVYFCSECKWITNSVCNWSVPASVFRMMWVYNNVSIQLRWCGKFYNSRMQNFLTIKTICKTVKIGWHQPKLQSYVKCHVFMDHRVQSMFVNNNSGMCNVVMAQFLDTSRDGFKHNCHPYHCVYV